MVQGIQLLSRATPKGGNAAAYTVASPDNAKELFMNGFKLVGNIDEICNYLNNELKGNVGLPIDNYMHEKQMKKIILDDFYKSKSLKEIKDK